MGFNWQPPRGPQGVKKEQSIEPEQKEWNARVEVQTERHDVGKRHTRRVPIPIRVRCHAPLPEAPTYQVEPILPSPIRCHLFLVLLDFLALSNPEIPSLLPVLVLDSCAGESSSGNNFRTVWCTDPRQMNNHGEVYHRI